MHATTPTLAVEIVDADPQADRAEFAASSFLARYSGNTLDVYRHDLRTFFRWAADRDLDVLEARDPATHRALPPDPRTA